MRFQYNAVITLSHCSEKKYNASFGGAVTAANNLVITELVKVAGYLTL
jgi:hypothetical protein